MHTLHDFEVSTRTGGSYGGLNVEVWRRAMGMGRRVGHRQDRRAVLAKGMRRERQSFGRCGEMALRVAAPTGDGVEGGVWILDTASWPGGG